MAPSLLFARGRRSIHGPARRRGVSELYAALLMIGITLSFGGTVASLALGQFGIANSSSAVALSVQEKYSQTEVSLVYATTSQSGACPLYQGSREGTLLNLTLFDYGSTAFAPVETVLNGTLYPAGLTTLQPGQMGSLSLAAVPAGTCVHASGQTVMLSDAYGDEVQFVT